MTKNLLEQNKFSIKNQIEIVVTIEQFLMHLAAH